MLAFLNYAVFQCLKIVFVLSAIVDPGEVLHSTGIKKSTLVVQKS